MAVTPKIPSVAQRLSLSLVRHFGSSRGVEVAGTAKFALVEDSPASGIGVHTPKPKISEIREDYRYEP